MATKWKYATVPAAQRLDMLRSGNDELYKEEIARTKDAISNRLAAGLDVDEQMKWADSVAYQYNLSKAADMGIDEKNVAKTGYAQRLFGDMTESVTKDKVSSVSAPQKLTSSKYYEDYTGYDRDSLAKSVIDSYVSGINKRAASLNQAYKNYADKISEEYDKKIAELQQQYRKDEKLYREARINDGTSEYSGRTMTDQLKSREQLLDMITQLRNEKDSYLSAAQESLREQLYSLSGDAMQSAADEYYRYNALLSDEKEAEYQKQRDAAEDDKWWQNFSFEKQQADIAAAERADERAAAQIKAENDLRIAEAELALAKSENDRDYEKWLKEFEADIKYQNSKLNSETALNNAKLALDREKFEYEKSSDEKENSDISAYLPESTVQEIKYGNSYKAYLDLAKKVSSMVVFNEKSNGYVKKYSDEQILSLIKTFNISVEEKESICKEIGIKYIG